MCDNLKIAAIHGLTCHRFGAHVLLFHRLCLFTLGVGNNPSAKYLQWIIFKLHTKYKQVKKKVSKTITLISICSQLESPIYGRDLCLCKCIVQFLVWSQWWRRTTDKNSSKPHISICLISSHQTHNRNEMASNKENIPCTDNEMMMVDNDRSMPLNSLGKLNRHNLYLVSMTHWLTHRLSIQCSYFRWFALASTQRQRTNGVRGLKTIDKGHI